MLCCILIVVFYNESHYEINDLLGSIYNSCCISFLKSSKDTDKIIQTDI